MTFLVITLIAFITAVALFFINDARKAKEAIRCWEQYNSIWKSMWENTFDDLIDLQMELNKWKRPRAKNGQFR